MTKQSLQMQHLMLVCCIFLFGIVPMTAQDILWEKSYGGKHADYLFDVIPTPDYGFLLAGSSLSKKTGNKTEDNRGDLDYWVWKMDEKGDLDWQKSFGGSGMDLLQCVKITNDGGFILGGQSSSGKGNDKESPNLGGEDIWILKLNPKGAIEWQLSLGGKGKEILQSITQTSDGGFILGATSSSDITDEDSLEKNSLTGLEDKVILKNTNSFGNLDYWIIKIDSKGKVKWQESFGGQYADILKTVIETKNGDIILGGYSNSSGNNNTVCGTGISKSEKCYGNSDYWILRLDKGGNVLWQKVFGGDADDYLQAMLITSDDNIIVAGNSNSQTTGNKNISNKKGTDFWVFEMDSDGNLLWQQSYDIGKVDILTSLIRNDDGTLLIGGFAQSEVSGTKRKDKESINDYVLIKTKPDGEELWRKTVGSEGEDILKKGIETRDGGYLLCGTSFGRPSSDKKSGMGRNDFWIVKLLDKEKPKKEKEILEAIPNPAADYTNLIIGFEFEKATLSLFDLSGRQLQNYTISERMVPLDLTGLPEGIYIAEVRSKENKGSVKIIKQRK